MPGKFAFERIDELLIKMGKIAAEDIKNPGNECEGNENLTGGDLIEKGLISEDELLQEISRSLNIKRLSLDSVFIGSDISKYVPLSIARKYHLVPIGISQGKLIAAISYPFEPYALNDISFTAGHDVEPVLATRKEIDELTKIVYSSEMEHDGSAGASSNKLFPNKDIKGLESAPAVSMINSIIAQAVKSRASDIHIEPFEDYVRVRFRVDGELREFLRTVKQAQSPLISRIKIISNLNIAEKRVPQEGRICMKVDGEEVDLRVAIMPTAFGEKAAIRILKRKNFLISKEGLGFKEDDLKMIETMIRMHCGIILITGPTGSGKSTTLYTLLNELNTVKRNIITIEDPVEYMIEGITQINVNNRLGLTFASGLKAILRQDPDVIMIGEIRDRETAEIAIRAAITGHLVFSTLHTNDAPGSVIRLIEMGAQPFLVSSALIGTIAQRLVKRICNSCKYEYKADEYEKALLGVEAHKKIALYRGRGCKACGHTGYYSRIAVYEIMEFAMRYKNIISQSNDFYGIRDICIKNGMKTLRENCIELVLGGITTVDELLRVINIWENASFS